MFTCRKHQVLLGLFAALLLVPTAYADVFVVIEGIEGESMARGFPGQPIDALSFEWGMSRPDAATGVSATRYSGAVNIQALTFTHYVDKSTPKLMEFCAVGKPIRRAIVAVRKTAGDENLNYFVLELDNVIVSSVELGGSDQSGRMIEQVSLQFTKYKIMYTETGERGEKKGIVETSYDIKAAAM